ncbi:MAG TPA: CHAD domain-containing protein [Chitinolyticbacter sp.]|nr:CHAD domain-containing protein [Chitinolyticbacter sp.]
MVRKRTLSRQLHALLDRIAQQRDPVLAGEPDALHQLRIALRGWRTLLPLILKRQETDVALLTAWRTLTRLTGPARDAEVQLQQLPPDHPARSTIAAQCAAGYAEVHTALTSVDWPVLMAASHAWLDIRLAERKRSVLRSRIRRRADKLEHRLDTDLAAPRDTERWHAMRIDVKRLRYLIEHAGSWLPKRQRKLYSALKTAQADLGELHDFDVQLAAGWRDDPAPRTALLASAEASAKALGIKFARLAR